MLRTAPALLAVLAMGSISLAQEAAPPAKQKQPGTPAARQNEQPRANANDPAAPARPQQPQAGRQPRQAGFRGAESATSLDPHIADCLLLANQHEIALLNFGIEKSENPKVKEFAEGAIKDHEKMVQSLRKFASPNHANVELQASAGTLGNRNLATTREARKVNPEDASKAATPESKTTPPESIRIANAERAGTPAADESSVTDRLFAIHQRATQECLALTRKELGELKGEKFDQAFLGQQMGMHMGMLAQLKAIQGEVSGELQQVAQGAEKTATTHKEHAEKLMEEVKGEGGGAASATRSEQPRAKTDTPATRKE
jgi:predicted outer membrane protein